MINSRIETDNNKQQLPKDVMGFILYFAKKYKIILVLALLVEVFENTGTLICSNYIIKILIDGLTSEKIKFNITIIYIFVYSISNYSLLLFQLLAKIIKFNSLTKMQNDIRNTLFQYLTKHSVMFFNNNFVGTINNKVNYLVNGIDIIFTNSINAFSDIIGFTFLFFIFLNRSLLLGIFFICWLIIYLKLFIYFSKKIEKASTEKANILSKFNGNFIDCISSILTVKSFSREKYEKGNIKKLNVNVLKKSKMLLIRNVL